MEVADLSNIALRRLSASYFSGELSDRLTDGQAYAVKKIVPSGAVAFMKVMKFFPSFV